MSTIFTEIIHRRAPARIVWENERFICFLPNDHFVNKGHLLLVPKEEVDYVFDLDDELYTELWSLAKPLAETLKNITGALRIGIAVEGFSVPHVHVHLCPIYDVAELDPHRSVKWPESERDAFCEQFQGAVQELYQPASV